jgi:hypothetical protein
MAGQSIVYSFITQFAAHRTYGWLLGSEPNRLPSEIHECSKVKTPEPLFASGIPLFEIEHRNRGTCAAAPAYIY